MSVVGYRKATRNYTKQRADMIDMQAGDVIEQLGTNQNGWCKGKNTRTGEAGWFPFAQSEEITKAEAEKLKAQYPQDDGYEYDDYYEDEEESEKDSGQAPANQAAAKPVASASEVTMLKQQVENYKKEIQKLKDNATIENVIKFQLNEAETNAALSQENEELKKQLLGLEAQLVEQKAAVEQLQIRNQKLAAQVKQFEAQEDKLNQYETEKAQLLEENQNKLKEKDLELQHIESMVQGQILGSDVAAQLHEVQQQLYSLEMENLKLSTELTRGKSGEQGTRYRVKARKQPRSRQNVKLSAEAVKVRYGGK